MVSEKTFRETTHSYFIRYQVQTLCLGVREREVVYTSRLCGSASARMKGFTVSILLLFFSQTRAIHWLLAKASERPAVSSAIHR